MNFKRVLEVLMIVAIVAMVCVFPVLAQSATPPTATAAPLTVPGALATAAAVVIGFFVTQGLKSLSQLLAKYRWLSWINMQGWSSWITSFVVAGLLFYANMALGFIPPADTPMAAMVLTFLTQVVSTNGLHYVVTGPAATPTATATK
jgi:hypothetical protein